LDVAFHVLEADAVDGFEGGDVEGAEVGVAEGEVAGGFGGVDFAEEFAVGGVDGDVVAGDPDVAFVVGADAVGRAVDVGDEGAHIGGGAVAVDVEDAEEAVVGVGDVEEAAVGGEGDAVGAAWGFGDEGEGAFGREMVDAVVVELAAFGLGAEGRVCEIDVAVFADGDVVGGVEAFAFELVGDDFEGAVLGGADDAFGAAFAGVEAALGIEGVAVGAVGSFAIGGFAVAVELPDDVVGDVGEEELPFLRPDRAFGEFEACGDAFDGEGAEEGGFLGVLGDGGRGE
jgi:hypothetical protein